MFPGLLWDQALPSIFCQNYNDFRIRLSKSLPETQAFLIDPKLLLDLYPKFFYLLIVFSYKMDYTGK